MDDIHFVDLCSHYLGFKGLTFILYIFVVAPIFVRVLSCAVVLGIHSCLLIVLI